MESRTSNTSLRQEALLAWLQGKCGLSISSLQNMPHDASFRRYFRLHTKDQSYVVMDAPPAQEQCLSFVAIAKLLREHRLEAPEVFAADLQQGFLLLSDLGEQTYLQALTTAKAHPLSVDHLYTQALDVLLQFHHIDTADQQLALPAFNREMMWREWEWHQQWFLGEWLNLNPEQTVLAEEMHTIIESACSQPQIFMHRDYHSANLMVLSGQAVGLLDFQDAHIGPLTYDLVSLLRDCYIDWPSVQIEALVHAYWRQLQTKKLLSDVALSLFLQWFDLMGMQRHLKALFTFARKAVRDQQPHYLRHIPRTLNYVLKTSAAYPQCAALHDYYKHIVKPAAAQRLAV
jgi:N-acetylmuramate 1-kinase